MPSSTTKITGLASIAEVLRLLLVVPTAYAAQAAQAVTDPLLVPLSTYVWVVVSIALGWGAANLPLIAQWEEANRERKLQIVQTILISVFSGFCAFYGARSVGATDMVAFIAVGIFSWMGTRGLEFIAGRVTGGANGGQNNGNK